MGGAGSGLAYDEEDLRRIAGLGLSLSPTTEVLLEESILGWKEYELEVMRDRRTTSSSSARSRTSTRWACTPATPSRSRRR
jgi:carbamoyl-phosphate synthase large subunit